VDFGLTVTLPRPLTSGAKAAGRFGKPDFVYLPDQDVYRCPAGAFLPYHFSNVEHGMTLRRYWSTAACSGCAIKQKCTTAKERRITRCGVFRSVAELERAQCGPPTIPLKKRRRHCCQHPTLLPSNHPENGVVWTLAPFWLRFDAASSGERQERLFKASDYAERPLHGRGPHPHSTLRRNHQVAALEPGNSSAVQHEARNGEGKPALP
jgi:hypothetical protein